jgi:hypothetical protein
MVDIRTGDDYTRMLEGWGRRELTKDRRGDHYRELIELHDGTRIESVARLADHHDKHWRRGSRRGWGRQEVRGGPGLVAVR